MLHLCYARWAVKDGSWQDGVAVLKEPGLYDVITFIAANGSPFQGEVYSYKLQPHNGAISIECPMSGHLTRI